MIIVLIHWRIKPEQEYIDAFLDFWRTEAMVNDRTGLAGEFLSDTLSPKEFPYITWHMDPDALGDHKSFVNVGIWNDANAFHEQIGKNFNDDKPMLAFEKYRRRRIVVKPNSYRIGGASLPKDDSPGVL